MFVLRRAYFQWLERIWSVERASRVAVAVAPAKFVSRSYGTLAVDLPLWQEAKTFRIADQAEGVHQ